MPRTRLVSLKALHFHRVAGLYGGPLAADDTDFDQPSCGGSSLSLAASEQRELERRRRAYIDQIAPYISARNVELLRAIFVDDQSLEEVAVAQGCRRQAVFQRLAVLCCRFEEVDAWWAERRRSVA